MSTPFPLRHEVTRIRRAPGPLDELGNDTTIESRTRVTVAGWAMPTTDEPKLAGHERRTVTLELYAPTSIFEVGDAVEIPGRDDVLEVIGEPENYESNPFGWKPGLEVVNLAGIQ